MEAATAAPGADRDLLLVDPVGQRVQMHHSRPSGAGRDQVGRSPLVPVWLGNPVNRVADVVATTTERPSIDGGACIPQRS